MKDENKNILHEEELKKFKYRVEYKVNESPRYRPLVGMDEVFDEVPKIEEAGDQEEAPKEAGGEVPPAPSNDVPQEAEPPVPDFDNSPEQPEDTEIPADVPIDGQSPMEMSSPEQQVDDIQNEIIKHNIEAMKSIHDQLTALNNMTQLLSSKLDNLDNEVEEVREPSNTEKLMSKKDVSYPYYFGLNDMWSDNWFDKQRESDSSKGIRELPDGTFIADFDDLPKQSKGNVQDSFNEID